MISPTHKRSIASTIKKIENSAFDEDDIKLLLINIRELISPKSFIKELAHFIAHPERERGLCYDELNLRALVMKQWVIETRIISSPMELISIKKPLYDIIFLTGLAGVKARQFPPKEKKNSDERKIRNFINDSYELDKKTNTFTLKKLENLQAIADIALRIFNELSARPIIDSKSLITNLNSDIKEIYNKFMKPLQYSDTILEHANDIIACIFCLFQDSQFKVFDGSIGRFEVNPVSKTEAPNNEHHSEIKDELINIAEAEIKSRILNEYGNRLLTLSGSFILNTTKNVSVLTQFISSELKVKDYVKGETIEKHAMGQLSHTDPSALSENSELLLDNFHTERDENNKLWLVNEK
jgi:hypothetical protein